MFTGIIEELGAVRRLSLSREGARLEVSGRTVVSDLRQGDSIAVNGVCLTVIERGAD
ncbi:MAG: riboflavin synthase, partial [Blastocatellia bacterium]|nr:riboflavin synthase [Blastocatellia bacterium]